MPNKTILVVSPDRPCVNQLAGICDSLKLRVGVPTIAVSVAVLFDQAKPALLCIDASHASEAEILVLFRHFVREASRQGIPRVVLLGQGQNAAFGCPDNQCVYCLFKGPRLPQAWEAVLCELLDIELQPVPAWNR